MKEMKLMLLVLLVAVTGCKSSDNSLTLLRAKEWQLKSMTENGKETKTPLTQAANGAMMRAESMQSGKLCGKQKEFRRKNR